MLTLRSRLFIIISAVVLVILAIVLLLLALSKKPGGILGANTPTGTTETENGNLPVGQSVPAVTDFSNVKVRPQTTEDAEKNAAKQMAKIFIERYNSYSSESNWQNVLDVQNFVTADLWKVIGRAPNKSGAGAAASSASVVTEVATLNLLSWDTASAKVAVMAQRTEMRGTVETKLNKNYQVDLVKTNGDWLVDNFKEVK